MTAAPHLPRGAAPRAGPSHPAQHVRQPHELCDSAYGVRRAVGWRVRGMWRGSGWGGAANMPSPSTARRSRCRRARSRRDHRASGSPAPAKVGSAAPSDHGATASTTAATAARTPPPSPPGTSTAAEACTGALRRPCTCSANPVPRPATADGTAAGRPSAPPSTRSSTVVTDPPMSTSAASSSASTAAAGRSRSAAPPSWTGTGDVGSRCTASVAVGESSPTSSSTGEPTARIGARSASPETASTSAPAKRTCTTVRLCSGAGQAASRGTRSSATDVPASSGSVGAHSRQACSTSAAAAPGQTIPPA